MKLFRSICSTILVLSSALLSIQNSNAHLMVAQQGTINIEGENAYVVVSVPISAFKEIDTNQDHQVTMIEFNNSRNLVTQKIKQNFMLVDEDKSAHLIDILLSPVQDHHSKVDYFEQLTVMGKFDVSNFSNKFKLTTDLFGFKSSEKTLKITLLRKKDQFKQVVLLTSDSPTAEFVLTAQIVEDKN